MRALVVPFSPELILRKKEFDCCWFGPCLLFVLVVSVFFELCWGLYAPPRVSPSFIWLVFFGAGPCCCCRCRDLTVNIHVLLSRAGQLDVLTSQYIILTRDSQGLVYSSFVFGGPYLVRAATSVGLGSLFSVVVGLCLLCVCVAFVCLNQ